MATAGKLPYLKLYVGDLRKEPTYTCLTIESRLVWLEMLFIMHGAIPRGYLEMSADEIARAISVPQKVVKKCLSEMERVGTFSRDDGGRIFNRRMVRETYLSEVRSEAGKAGAEAQNLPQQKRGKKNNLPLQTDHIRNGKTGPFTDPDNEIGFDCSLEKQVPIPETALACVLPDQSMLRWQELKKIYWAAGKGWQEGREQMLFQRYISLEDNRQVRVIDYVKRRLLDGTWRDPQHTKSLQNLLADADFDMPELQRTLPNVRQQTPAEAAHDRAAARFLAKQGAQ